MSGIISTLLSKKKLPPSYNSHGHIYTPVGGSYGMTFYTEIKRKGYALKINFVPNEYMVLKLNQKPKASIGYGGKEELYAFTEESTIYKNMDVLNSITETGRVLGITFLSPELYDHAIINADDFEHKYQTFFGISNFNKFGVKSVHLTLMNNLIVDNFYEFNHNTISTLKSDDHFVLNALNRMRIYPISITEEHVKCIFKKFCIIAYFNNIIHSDLLWQNIMLKEKDCVLLDFDSHIVINPTISSEPNVLLKLLKIIDCAFSDKSFKPPLLNLLLFGTYSKNINTDFKSQLKPFITQVSIFIKGRPAQYKISHYFEDQLLMLIDFSLEFLEYIPDSESQREIILLIRDDFKSQLDISDVLPLAPTLPIPPTPSIPPPPFVESQQPLPPAPIPPTPFYDVYQIRSMGKSIKRHNDRSDRLKSLLPYYGYGGSKKRIKRRTKQIRKTKRMKNTTKRRKHK